MRGAKIAQRGLVSRLPFAQNNAHHDLLPVMGIGDAGGRSVQHRRVAQQHFVNFTRRDVLAALDDQLFDAPGHKEKTIRVAVPQIAGAQPTVGREAGLRGCLVFVIAAHHLRAPDGDLAGAAVGNRLQGRVDHAGFAT